MFSFLYPFANFFQPGVFWPELAAFKPMQLLSLLGLLAAFAGKAAYPRSMAYKHPIFKATLWFIVIQAVSHYSAGVAEILSEFGFWSVYPLFMVVSFGLLKDIDSLRRFLWGAIVGCMFIVGFGIYAVIAGLPNAIGGRAGAYGMYENHNDYTFVIIQILPFIYAFLRVEQSWWRKVLLSGSILTCILGVFMSLSRGGVLALVLELGLIIGLTMSKRSKRILFPILIAFGVAAVGYQWAKRAENQGDNYTAEDAQESREELWRAGFQMIIRHPILGVGSRTFGEHAPEYGEISHDNRGKNSHNTYIEVLATSGLLGFWAFAAMLRGIWRESARPPEHVVSPFLDATRQAVRITLISIMFRALLGAKPWDWSLYFLGIVAIVAGCLQRHLEQAAKPAPAAPPPAGPARGIAPARR